MYRDNCIEIRIVYFLFCYYFLYFYFFYICTLLLISLVYSSIYGVCLVGTPRPFASPLSNTSLFLFFCSMLVMHCLIKASNNNNNNNNGQGSGKWTVEDVLWVVDVEDFWIDCRGWVAASDG